MKARNQPTINSEADAKEKLVVYVYEYLVQVGAKRAAQAFLEDIQWKEDIQLGNQQDGPGFLFNWWSVFWDLYCAAPEKRNQPEPTSEARAFHEFQMRGVMSPSTYIQTSPPQQGPLQFMGGGGSVIGGTRYGPPMRSGGPMNVGLRMQPMMTQGGPPLLPPHHQHQMAGSHPSPHTSMIGSGSPRYAPHPGLMTPGSSTSSIGPDLGPSPGINRMTPNHAGSPLSQVGSSMTPNGVSPMGAHQGHSTGGSMGLVQTIQQQQHHQQQPRVGLTQPTHSWQGTFSGIHSPGDQQQQQQCFIPGPQPVTSSQSNDFGVMNLMNDGSMMEVKPANVPPDQQDEYAMPNAYGQSSDLNEAGSEILKIKESLETNTKEYSDNDSNLFSIDFPDAQSKW